MMIYLREFVKFLKTKYVLKVSPRKPIIRADDLFYVMLAIARMAQSEAFGSVISLLKNHAEY